MLFSFIFQERSDDNEPTFFSMQLQGFPNPVDPEEA